MKIRTRAAVLGGSIIAAVAAGLFVPAALADISAQLGVTTNAYHDVALPTGSVTPGCGTTEALCVKTRGAVTAPAANCPKPKPTCLTTLPQGQQAVTYTARVTNNESVTGGYTARIVSVQVLDSAGIDVTNTPRVALTGQTTILPGKTVIPAVVSDVFRFQVDGAPRTVQFTMKVVVEFDCPEQDGITKLMTLPVTA